MACYTLCDCLLKQMELDKKYITDVLMVFTQQTNPHKIALDKSDKILNIYTQIAEKSEIISSWLFLMTMKPSSFEIIDVDLSNEEDEDEIYLTVCSRTKSQQKAIVNSHERWKKYKYQSSGVIIYDDVPIIIYDRDEAIHELSQPINTNITAIGSVIAMDKSQISETKINTNEKP